MYSLKTLKYLMNETGLSLWKALNEISKTVLFRKKEGIAGIIRFHAAQEPFRPAVICGGESMNYSQLFTRANSLASFLLSRGVAPGDKVAIMAQNCIQLPELWTIMNLAKFSAIPLNWRLRRDEIGYILSDSECRNIIYQEHLREEINYSNIPLKNKIVIGKEARDGEILYDEAVNAGGSADLSRIAIDPSTIVYTSGTTGKPKGAHRTTTPHFLLFVASMVYEFGFRHDDIHLVVCPLYHSAPLAFMTLQLLIGTTQVVLPKFDPEEMLRAIEKYRVTSIFVVPYMIIEILNLPDSVIHKYDLSSLRTVICAAAPLSAHHKRSFQQRIGRVLYEFYGATETGINTILKPEEIEKKAESVGMVCHYNRIKILDDQKKEVPLNTPGEIYVKNPFIMNGYYRRSSETEERMHCGYLTVGDVGRIDEDGYLYILDRKTDMVISGGVNIYPAEIEDALLKHSAVKFAAVIGVPDQKWGERLKAFIVKKDKSSVDKNELEIFLRTMIASFKIPKDWEFVDSLPMTPSGKVLKRELRQQQIK